LELTDTAADGYLERVIKIGSFKRLPDACSHNRGSGQICVRHDDNEFFSTIASDLIRDADCLPDDVRSLPDDKIPDLMTIRVIDGLEIIKIQDQDAQRNIHASGTPDFFSQSSKRSFVIE